MLFHDMAAGAYGLAMGGMRVEAARKPTVGFIGLGLMGEGMARRLMAAGHAMTVLAHRRREVVEALRAEGAAEAEDAADLAARCEVVLTCVPDADAVAALAERVVPALGPGHLWIDVTTSRPALTRELGVAVRARGAAFADAPVTGGPPQAASGELASLVGCDEADFPAVEAVVGAYSKVVLRFGEVGAGHTAKLLNNLVSQGTMALLAEAYGLARAHGVAWRPLFEAMSAGAARSGTLEKSVGPALGGDYSGARFTIANAAKDLRYVVELAGAPDSCPVASAVHEALRTQVDAGHAEVFVSRLLDPAIAPR